MKKYCKFLPLLLLLSACNEIPREAYFNRGDPESLLDASSEVVSVQLSSDSSVQEVVEWVDKDQPTRAELLCMEGDPLCTATQEVLGVYGIDYRVAPSAENTVHLIYERVLARDCENRYIDNHINPYNMSHPTYGCSTASNMVRMVSDKRQFINPALLDYLDSERGEKVYQSLYLNPTQESSSEQNVKVEDLKTD